MWKMHSNNTAAIDCISTDWLYLIIVCILVLSEHLWIITSKRHRKRGRYEVTASLWGILNVSLLALFCLNWGGSRNQEWFFTTVFIISFRRTRLDAATFNLLCSKLSRELTLSAEKDVKLWTDSRLDFSGFMNLLPFLYHLDVLLFTHVSWFL